MKKTVTLLCACITWCGVMAQTPVLKINEEGKYKIAQFTDTHLDLSTDYRRAQSARTIDQLNYILDSEKPDLVIFTGDVVTGKPAAEGWKMILAPVAERNLPFCVTLGNHDAEQDISRTEIAEIVTSFKGTLNTRKSGELDDVALEVMSRKGDKVDKVLYCIDSHDYSTLDGVDGYAWITREQIDWYRSLSAKYAAANGNRPLPSMAFFHICLHEFAPAWANDENTHAGRRAEDECPGVLNTGMYSSMVEMGDICGVFVGHDHDIDYVVAQNGIALGYGRFSGYDTTYNNLRHGVRIIELHEGVREFESWIHERDGRIVNRILFRDGKIERLD
ncbi:metallophosphoesterase family protein [Alistipes sp.]|uniref:metallophosphoesterase family protein n=1 Tax=Alistipes sp. TaxID=1872444 RepID=UPI0025C6D77E|nr:metallophosphoesterase family protein [Alistipes sp.]